MSVVNPDFARLYETACASFTDCRDGRYFHASHGLVSAAERDALIEAQLEEASLDRNLVRREAEDLGLDARAINRAVEHATLRTMEEWPFPTERSARSFAEMELTRQAPVIRSSTKLLAALGDYVVERAGKARAAHTHESSDPLDRFADLQRQGFMRGVKPRKVKKERPVVTCHDCMDWHREGQHTKPAAERKANRARKAAKAKPVDESMASDRRVAQLATRLIDKIDAVQDQYAKVERAKDAARAAVAKKVEARRARYDNAPVPQLPASEQQAIAKLWADVEDAYNIGQFWEREGAPLVNRLGRLLQMSTAPLYSAQWSNLYNTYTPIGQVGRKLDTKRLRTDLKTLHLRPFHVEFYDKVVRGRALVALGTLKPGEQFAIATGSLAGYWQAVSTTPKGTQFKVKNRLTGEAAKMTSREQVIPLSAEEALRGQRLAKAHQAHMAQLAEGIDESVDEARRKSNDKLRDQDNPNVLGYNLNKRSLTPKRRSINTKAPGDYGADPLGDGTFRMVPSGDIVDFEERNRRLKARHESIDESGPSEELLLKFLVPGKSVLIQNVWWTLKKRDVSADRATLSLASFALKDGVKKQPDKSMAWTTLLAAVQGGKYGIAIEGRNYGPTQDRDKRAAVRAKAGLPKARGTSESTEQPGEPR